MHEIYIIIIGQSDFLSVTSAKHDTQATIAQSTIVRPRSREAQYTKFAQSAIVALVTLKDLHATANVKNAAGR